VTVPEVVQESQTSLEFEAALLPSHGNPQVVYRRPLQHGKTIVKNCYEWYTGMSD
jgi:hypothetical protein